MSSNNSNDFALETLWKTVFKDTIGYSSLAHQIRRGSTNPTFPPYNIVKNGDGAHEIQVALAGYNKDDIEVMQDEDMVILRTVKDLETDKDVKEDNFQYRGIAKRKFELKFSLGRNREVSSANMKDGMLIVDIDKPNPEQVRKLEIK